MDSQNRFILTLSCPDKPGIVYNVAGFLFERGYTIIDSAQFGDEDTGLFFMRVIFAVDGAVEEPVDALAAAFSDIAGTYSMNWQIHDCAHRPRVLLMVSKFGHCLNDLLYRYRIGALPVDMRAIVSNHREFYQLSASYDIPFHHLPVTKANKQAQEDKLLAMIDEEQIELIVLARYMQILSPRVCERLPGRIINIHHSFLPSFKGAQPYRQAYDRGVKLIGATAHYVTPALDEGPIIEQEVVRVDHSMTPEDLAGAGRDVESVVLARAVKAHIERRVLINSHRTVIFR